MGQEEHRAKANRKKRCLIVRKAVLSSIASILFLSACAGEPVGESASGSGSQPVDGVSFTKHAGRIEVFLEGRPFTAFHYEEEWDKPFLYPLRTSSGLVISRGYPIDPHPGEERDHDWHRGIWYGHGDINGHDFWRELGRDKTGLIVPIAEPTHRTEGERGSIAAELGLQTETQEIIGTLRGVYTFSMSDEAILIDAALSVRADKGRDLRFGDTEDGGFAVRLADAFRQDRGAILLNSEGQTGTENIWGKAARWVDYSATIDGRDVGATMIDHPSNLRHATRWHARGYSLFSANPFGLASFTGHPGDDGSFTLPEGEMTTLRYRIVIREGTRTPEDLEQLFREFADTSPR